MPGKPLFREEALKTQLRSGGKWGAGETSPLRPSRPVGAAGWLCPAAVTFHMLRAAGGNWNKCGLKGAQKPRSWGFVCGRAAAAHTHPFPGLAGGCRDACARTRHACARRGTAVSWRGAVHGCLTRGDDARMLWCAGGGPGCCGGCAPFTVPSGSRERGEEKTAGRRGPGEGQREKEGEG